MSGVQQRTLRGSHRRWLRIELLEWRQLLAAESLVGSAWEDAWRGPSLPGDELSEFDDGLTADLNMDGHRDLLFRHGHDAEVRFGRGDGTFGGPIAIPTLPTPWVVADFDTDGDDDLLSVDGPQLKILENLGVVDGVWSGFSTFDTVALPAGVSVPSTAQLVAADWNSDGRADVAIETTRGVLVYLSNEQGTIGDPIEYSLTGSNQRRLVAGDFDEDGDSDLVVASTSDAGASLTMLTNDGSGIFEPDLRDTRLKQEVVDLVAGDLDADGDLDLVLAYGYSYAGNVAVILNTGGSQFEEEPLLLTVSGSPQQLALGDLDADGDLDLSIGHSSGAHIPYSGSPGIAVFMGDGEGRFGPRAFVRRLDSFATLVDQLDASAGLEIVAFSRRGAIHVLRRATPLLLPAVIETNGFDGPSDEALWNTTATGDWNGDGLADQIQAQFGSSPASQGYRLLVTQPDGSFLPSALPTIENTGSWTIAELTGDGRNDIAFTTFDRGTLVVLPQLPDARVGSPVETTVTGAGLSLVGTYDFNTDGLPDVVVRHESGVVHLMLGAGGGKFSLGPMVAQANDVRFADLNGDSRPDLTVLGSGKLQSLLSREDGSFQEAFSLVVGPSLDRYFNLFGDITSDGQMDVILGSEFEVRVFTGRTDGTFQEVEGSPLRSQFKEWWNSWFDDLNGDGRNDLTIHFGPTLVTWLAESNGRLAAPAEISVLSSSWPQRKEDINDDQLIDLILSANGQTTVLLGRPDGSYQQAFEPVQGAAAWSSVTEDYNGDDLRDLTIVSAAGLKVWTRQAGGSFQAFFTLPLASASPWVRWAKDINGDGRTDYVIQSDRIRVVLAAEQTAFVESFLFPAEINEIAFEDVTGDGRLDAVTWSYEGPIRVWHQQLDNTFSALSSTNAKGQFVDALDIDGDGWSELLTLRGNYDDLVIWRNVQGTHFEEYFSVPADDWIPSDAMAVADLNRDGRNDLVIGWQSSGPGQRLSVLLSEPDGTLARPLTYVFPRRFNLGSVVVGDVDQDGDLDVQLEGHDYVDNLNGSTPVTRLGVVLNQADQLWPVGDANRDGQFDSSDLVAVFQLGEYEDEIVGNSSWIDGDWDGDGEFSTGDLVLAFQQGTYAAAAELPTAAAPTRK